MSYDFEKAGIDLKSASERFMNNENVYTKHLYKFLFKNYLDNPMQEINLGKYDEAFNELHSLKGIASNLSLVKLADRISPVVEDLRNNRVPSEDSLEDLKQEYENITNVVRDIQENDIPLF